MVSGDIEILEKFQRNYRLVRTALEAVPATILQRAAPECRYVVTNSEGQVALAGVAVPAAKNVVQIDLRDRLPPGHYSMSMLMAVAGNATNAEIKQIEFTVPFAR
jgi:hypothetical protein